MRGGLLAAGLVVLLAWPVGAALGAPAADGACPSPPEAAAGPDACAPSPSLAASPDTGASPPAPAASPDTCAPPQASPNLPEGRPPAPGDLAPAFSLPDLHGQRVCLQQFRGRPTVLMFWACWCDTWKDSLSRLKDLRRTRPHLGFEALFVAVDSRTRALAEPLLLREGMPFPVALDFRSEVSRRYRVTTVPTLFLLDARGVVRFVHQAYPGNRVLAREIAACSQPVGPLPDLAPEGVASFLLPVELELWTSLNRERRSRGLEPLAFEPALTEVGREYLQRRVGEPLSHSGPEAPDARIRSRGLRYAKVGENLARAATPRAALQSMLDSPIHKANLLSPRFDRAGVAAVREGAEGFVFCVLFGSTRRR